MDTSTEVSPYLKNPQPYVALHESTSQEIDIYGLQTTISLSPEEIADVRAAVAELLVFGFHGTRLNNHARSLIAMGAGGVILFDRNFEDPDQVACLCADLKREAGSRPFLIMVDQEGGYVQRLGPPFTVIPHARTVGDTNDPEAAAAIASILGRELRAVNIDMNLAPVLDVDTNPQSTVIGKRSFGKTPSGVAEFGRGSVNLAPVLDVDTNPQSTVIERIAFGKKISRVAEFKYAFIRSLQREGVAACAKHYPGHGDTAPDSHVHLPLLCHSLKRLTEVELPPFAKAVDADVAAVMIAHIDVPCFNQHPETTNNKPATMSKDAVDYLRNNLLFEGVVIADCLEMGAVLRNYSVGEAATQAVLAGVDMVLVSHTSSRQVAVVNTLVQEVLRGRIPYQRVKDAVSRIAGLKQTYVRAPHSKAEESFWESEIYHIGCKEHHDIVANVLHQSAAVSGRQVTRRRKFFWSLW